MKQINLIFIGTARFGVPTLQKLMADPEIKIVAVCTQPDRQAGRTQVKTVSPIKQLAQAFNLSLYQPDNINSAESISILKSLHPDYLVVIAYGQILSQDLLNIPAKMPLNVHASLLPQYRGASPIQNTLFHGESYAGLTIQKIAWKLDAGDILKQIKIPLQGMEIYPEVEQCLSLKTADLLISTIKNPGQLIPQDETQASYCHKIVKNDGYILFQKSSAADIYNKYRAFYTWPGIFTFFNQKRLKLLKIELIDPHQLINQPGVIFKSNSNQVLVQCQKGVIALKEVQLEGKKKMNINEFILGYSGFIKTNLL
jgi:methionyl-tRNA formyltransferase